MNEIYDEILSKIRSLMIPQEGYYLFSEAGFFWGVNSKKEIAFLFDSIQRNMNPIKQSTRYIDLLVNSYFDIFNNSNMETKMMSGLVLKTNNEKYVEMFIRLLYTMSEQELNETKLVQYFSYLKDLFANEKKPSLTELQGMYGELFTMYYLKVNHGINISKYYQSEDRSKFDFSLTDKKKIEVKSTLKQERIHHFLQHQLNTETFDIIVCSLQFQKDDAGMTLLSLVNECKKAFYNDIALIIHIESMCKSLETEDLLSISFNPQYTENHFRIFKAEDLPRVKEKNAEGVFNVEYDVDCVNVQPIDINRFANWVNELVIDRV